VRDILFIGTNVYSWENNILLTVSNQ